MSDPFASVHLVGIGGKLRSGKDAFADHLVSAHGFTKMNMSDPMNAAARVMNPWIPVSKPSGALVWVRYADLVDEIGFTEAKKNPEVRRFLQVTGADFGRDMVDVNIWQRMHSRNIDRAIATGLKVVITGVRFPNEADMISDRAGTLVWVNRPDVSGLAGALAAHTTETGITADAFDLVVQNDGTLADLYSQADSLVRRDKAAA